jgi:glycosyltransferase involved in cell wall biosynthesis
MTKPLHIVHTEASCGWGGQEIRILNEAAGMQRRGHAVMLLCPSQAAIHREALARGVPVTALPVARQRLGGLLAVRRWLGANRPDVINTHSSTDTWLVAAASCLLRDPPPLVRTRHISAPIPDNMPTRWLYTRATRHIVTTGEALRQEIVNQFGIPGERVTSVPTGVGREFEPGDRSAARASLGLPAEAFVIGIVATLRSWKGHRYLLQAFARFNDPTAHLVIVGDGPQRETLAQQIAALGLSGRVTMPGNRHDVLPWFQAMDVFALPSYANEGVPQAVLQAMSCGLTVVTTPIGSIPEAVTHDETGLLVAPQDAEALRAALERLRADARLRERLGRRARERACSRFAQDVMLDNMERVFRRVLEVGHGGR